MGSPDPAPDRVGPSQPPLNFVDGNGYIVLRGLVEARDCEVGWNKVMKAWGSGDEKVVAKNFELFFNAAQSEEQAKDPALPRRWQSKSTLGSGVGGALFKKFHRHLTEIVPRVGDLHPMTPGSVIVASVGSGPQLPHTDVASHPEVLPPHDREVGDCHLSSFLCLLEDYQVAVQAGTALGEAREARWDTVELHRGDMLLMVATSRHHGLPALPDSKDGLQGALFNLWTPDPRHKHHQPDTTHLDTTPPNEALDVAGDLSSWDCPSVDQVLWVGKGAVGRVGLWEGEAAQALFADPPPDAPGRPPHLPLPPHLHLPVGPGLRPRRHRGRRAVHAVLRGQRAPAGGLRGGQCRCGVGDPLCHVWHCPPGSADHAVAPGEHGPSVAVAQVREDRGMEHHLPMRVQGVLACVFALCIGKLDEFHVTKCFANSLEM